jgi:transcription termination factor NusB
MKKKEFYKDRHKKIIKSLRRISSTLANLKEERLTDAEINVLRSESYELIRQINQLEAGRNIFVDNDKDQ